jgi:hypothetical protein
LKKVVDDSMGRTFYTIEGVKEVAKHVPLKYAPKVFSDIAEEFARFIPFIGPTIGYGISDATTYYILDDSLTTMANLALRVLRYSAEYGAGTGKGPGKASHAHSEL